MFFCIGVGTNIDSVHLRQLGAAANDGKTLIKIGKDNISEIVIEDRNFSSDWAEVFTNLSNTINRKMEALI
jgi:hypothetical protein